MCMLYRYALSLDHLRSLLAAGPPVGQTKRYYICGEAPIVETSAADTLLSGKTSMVLADAHQRKNIYPQG